MKNIFTVLTALSLAILSYSGPLMAGPGSSDSVESLTTPPPAVKPMPVDSCDDVINLRNERIRELEYQVRTLTPGTCENECRDRSDDDYATCMEVCRTARGLSERDGRIGSKLSRW